LPHYFYFLKICGTKLLDINYFKISIGF